MILQSLFNYYKILLDDSELAVAEPGYSNAPVSFALNLSETGELLDVIPLSVPVTMGKKIEERPLRVNVPEQVKRSSNIAANFLCDNAAYVLGITEKEAQDPAYAEKRLQDFKEKNIEILSTAKSHLAGAVIAFLQRYDPETAFQIPAIARNKEELLKGGNLIFQVQGKNVLDDPEIRRVWEKYKAGHSTNAMQCLVTGEMEQIERLHPNIQGVRDAQSKGASLVSFNKDAFTSYGRTQGSNAPVSKRVASGYGIALNYLLSNQNPNRKIYLGDTTVVYWADSPDKRYPSAFYAFLNPEFQSEEEQPIEEDQGKRKRAKAEEKRMGEVAESIKKAKAIDLTALREGLDDRTRFYVLGLAPNAGRIAVRFFLTEPFGIFADRIMQHYEDLQIKKVFPNEPTYLSPYRILAECVSPKVTRRDDEVKKSWSLLGGAFMRAILSGGPYPEGLYAAFLNRIRHDTDETPSEGGGRIVKINYVRAAYIKAHLIRKYRRQGVNPFQEALQMSLNETYSHPAYVLGRLFAVLERAQQSALGQNVNATIKDRYFTTACTSPGSVFPILLRLSQHHLNKAEYGSYLENDIQRLVGMLEAKPFPARLTLDEQGIFILGYYHQRGFRKAKPTTEEVSDPEDLGSE